MPGIVVLASGQGTNLQALIDARRSGHLPAEIALVGSHRSDAYALERARAAGLPTVVVPLHDRRDVVQRIQFEADLWAALAPYDPELIVLAGWMIILSEAFLTRCPCPLLNVHPALLPMNEGETLGIPELRGAHAVRQALALRLPYTGVSVHHVTPQVDAGPVVARQVVTIEPDDDEESLYGRIKAVEHRLLPQAIGAVLHTTISGGIHA